MGTNALAQTTFFQRKELQNIRVVYLLENLLKKVDLPLATPSILAGVNQTVMLSLAMVVVASLIGAKGLGQDVLEALQYANVGQGILAGIAILFVALILDRVVQGKKRV